MRKGIISILLILSCVTVAAQPPISGGGKPRGGPGGGRPPMHGQGNSEDSFMIMGLPEIPGLSLDKREKLSKEITNEKKDVSKLMQQKQKVKADSQNPGMAERDRQKLFEKMKKIDEKIEKNEEKYDKKYRKILNDEQYNVFIINKKNIQFKEKGRRKGMGRDGRQQPPMRPEGNMSPPDMPEEDMF